MSKKCVKCGNGNLIAPILVGAAAGGLGYGLSSFAQNLVNPPSQQNMVGGNNGGNQRTIDELIKQAQSQQGTNFDDDNFIIPGLPTFGQQQTELAGGGELFVDLFDPQNTDKDALSNEERFDLIRTQGNLESFSF